MNSGKKLQSGLQEGEVKTMANSATQREKILDYCEKHGSITVREAFVELNINSPTKRISELRRAGYDVQQETQYSINDSSKKTKFVRYYIKRKEVKSA